MTWIPFCWGLQESQEWLPPRNPCLPSTSHVHTAALHEGCSTPDSGTLGVFTDVLFIMVSCKLALTDPDERTSKYSTTVGTFSVLQAPQILTTGDVSVITTQARWAAASVEISLSPYIPLYCCHFCQRHRKTPKQRLFPAGTVIKSWKKCRIWNYWYKSEHPLLLELAAFQNSLTAKSKTAPHHLKNQKLISKERCSVYQSFLFRRPYVPNWNYGCHHC